MKLTNKEDQKIVKPDRLEPEAMKEAQLSSAQLSSAQQVAYIIKSPEPSLTLQWPEVWR